MDEPLVEEIVSIDGLLKIEIRRRPDGTLRLYTFYWYEEIVPEYDFEECGWAKIASDVTIVDTIERARVLHTALKVRARPRVSEAGGRERARPRLSDRLSLLARLHAMPRRNRASHVPRAASRRRASTA
jgi:hypothetical protein